MSSDTVPRVAVGNAPRTAERCGRTTADALRTVRAVYDGRDVRFAPTDRFAFRHRTVRHHNVALLSSAVSTSAAASFTPDGTPVLAWSTAGCLRVDDDDAPTRPGVPVLLPTDRPFTLLVPAGTVQVLRVDRGFLDAVNGVVFEHRFAGRLRSRPAEAEVSHLLARIDAVAVNALHPDRNPGGHLSAQVLLAESVLGAFGGADAEPDARPVRRTVNTVQLAQAWLAEHCDRQLQLADVCGAVGVSSRTLQENFVQHVGVSPMTYLLQVRLDRVRIALQLADCAQTTVAEVAHRWGFRHMGRFSSTYFQRFDEYPRKTLQTST